MKSKIWIQIMMVILLSASVLADTSVEVAVSTSQDLNAWFELEAGGDMDVWINGVKQTQQNRQDSQGHLEGSIVGKIIDGIYSAKNGLLFRGPGANLNDISRSIGEALYTVYVTRAEHNMQTFAIDLRMRAIENTLDNLYGEEFCIEKIKLMNEYDNVASVNCYDGTHYRNGMIINTNNGGNKNETN